MGINIRSVNRWNLKPEFELIRTTLSAPSKTKKRFLSVDTEFPGIVLRKTPDPDSPKNKDGVYSNQARYDVMRESVENTKLIQLGITVFNDDRHSRDVWEFNFKGFDMENDQYNPESVRFLEEHGVDFENNKKQGIRVEDFVQEFKDMLIDAKRNSLWLTWVFFHCTYDLGYLVKILTPEGKLPASVGTFIETVPTCLGSPRVFDLKMMVDQKLGLDKLAENLKVPRIGQRHQAGSDSLLTNDCFVALFNSLETDEKKGELWNECRFKLHGFDGLKPTTTNASSKLLLPLLPPPQMQNNTLLALLQNNPVLQYNNTLLADSRHNFGQTIMPKSKSNKKLQAAAAAPPPGFADVPFGAYPYLPDHDVECVKQMVRSR